MSKVYDQTGDYMPQTDAGFDNWLMNFSSLIAADPEKYGMTQADAEVITNHYESYHPLYQKCQQPSVRTTSLIQDKDAVKASAMSSCRVFAMLIKNNQGVDEQAKSALGLRINDTTRTPIPEPDTAPMLNIIGTFSGEHVIRYADENSPDSKRKPHGATQIELYVHVGPTATVDWTQATFVGAFGKNPLRHSFQPEDANKVASYFARWRTARGLVGPWSLPVAMTIAFGGPVDQQMPTGGTSLPGDGELKIAA
jgi:hypothetical protein